MMTVIYIAEGVIALFVVYFFYKWYKKQREKDYIEVEEED